MDRDLAIRLDVLAAKREKSKGEVIAEALQRYVTQEEKNHG